MKILFLNHNFQNFGTYFRCFYLARHLSKKGIKVDLICASASNLDLKIKQKEINENFKIITLPRIRFHPYHTGHSLRALINSAIVLFKNYDILHSFAVAQPAIAFPTLVCKIFKGKPIIVDWDDLWGGGFGKYHPRLINTAFSFLEGNVTKLSDRITVASEFLKAKARAYKCPENKIVKIINGADIDSIRPMGKEDSRKKFGFKNEEIILLSIGHTYMDTLGILLETYRKVLAQMNNVKLILVGALGRQGNSVYKDILAFGEHLLLLGERPYSDIPYLLGCADVLVLPMSNGVIEQARFPIRFGDYLASGRPIASNAVGEVKKIISEEKCGLCSEPLDTDSFAEKIIELINNEQLRQELGRRAREVAEERLSWEKISGDLLRVYGQVLE